MKTKEKYSIKEHLKSEAYHGLYNTNYALQRLNVWALINNPKKIDNREGRDFLKIQDDIESLLKAIDKIFNKF